MIKRKEISKTLKKEIIERDKYQCCICRETFLSKDLNLHHPHPLCLNGELREKENLVVICHNCHYKLTQIFLSKELPIIKKRLKIEDFINIWSEQKLIFYINGKFRPDYKQLIKITEKEQPIKINEYDSVQCPKCNKSLLDIKNDFSRCQNCGFKWSKKRAGRLPKEYNFFINLRKRCMG